MTLLRTWFRFITLARGVWQDNRNELYAFHVIVFNVQTSLITMWQFKNVVPSLLTVQYEYLGKGDPPLPPPPPPERYVIYEWSLFAELSTFFAKLLSNTNIRLSARSPFQRK